MFKVFGHYVIDNVIFIYLLFIYICIYIYHSLKYHLLFCDVLSISDLFSALFSDRRVEHHTFLGLGFDVFRIF